MQQPTNDKKPGLSWSTPTTSTSIPKMQPVKQDTPTSSFTTKTTSGSGNLLARYAGIFVGGLVVGVLFAWSWSGLTHKDDAVSAGNATSTVTTATKTKDTTQATTKTTTSPNAVAATDTASLLTVQSPQAAGQSVTIEKVEVSKPTWVVVYDNNNGVPGNVLGAQLFFSTDSGTVTLLRPTIAGKSYFVGRSTDNGDRRFQKVGDQAVVDASGNLLVSTFTAN